MPQARKGVRGKDGTSCPRFSTHLTSGLPLGVRHSKGTRQRSPPLAKLGLAALKAL